MQMGGLVGDVDADNNDGCEYMQVRVYCACLPDSLLIYALDRPSSQDEQRQNTLHFQSYDSSCREPERKLRGAL
jgi:hypothetical protein